MELRHYVMICKNSGECIRTAPGHRSNDVVYDASVKSLVVYLSVVQFLPYGRIANFLNDVLALSPSEESLVIWVNEAKRNALSIVDKTKKYIMSSNVVGFDESGCYCNKQLDWAWIAQTVCYNLLFRANSRGSKVLTGQFGDSLERMTAVTDRYSAYFDKIWKYFKNQILYLKIPYTRKTFYRALLKHTDYSLTTTSDMIAYEILHSINEFIKDNYIKIDKMYY